MNFQNIQGITFFKSKHFPYALILFFILLFNWVGVFGSEILHNDDQFQYWFSGLENHLLLKEMKRSLFSPFLNFVFFKVMAYSPELARLLVVVLFMVPLSWSFFYLLRTHFHLPVPVSVTAAVLPNMLPGQILIPAYVNGSLVSQGVLCAVISLILLFRFVDSPDGKRPLIYSVLLYVTAGQVMGERAVFLFPPILVVILFSKISIKWKVISASGFVAVALSKVITTLLWPWGQVNQIHELSAGAILYRMKVFLVTTLPFTTNEPFFYSQGWIFSAALVLLLTAWGIFLNMKHPKVLIRSDGDVADQALKKAVLMIYLFVLVWVMSTSFPFLFLSKRFVPRYFYMASFGVNALLVISLATIYRHFLPKSKKGLAVGFCVLIVLSGICRHMNLEEFFGYHNMIKRTVLSSIGHIEMPRNAQLVVISEWTNLKDGYVGKLAKSKGYFKFITGRHDVSGLFGREYPFCDPFAKEKGLGWRDKMTGLSHKKPVFLFRMERPETRLVQLEYFLQWKAKTSEWILYRAECDSGETEIVTKGKGRKAYHSSLKALGISGKEVLWGGC